MTTWLDEAVAEGSRQNAVFSGPVTIKPQRPIVIDPSGDPIYTLNGLSELKFKSNVIGSAEAYTAFNALAGQATRADSFSGVIATENDRRHSLHCAPETLIPGATYAGFVYSQLETSKVEGFVRSQLEALGNDGAAHNFTTIRRMQLASAIAASATFYRVRIIGIVGTITDPPPPLATRVEGAEVALVSAFKSLALLEPGSLSPSPRFKKALEVGYAPCEAIVCGDVLTSVTGLDQHKIDGAHHEADRMHLFHVSRLSGSAQRDRFGRPRTRCRPSSSRWRRRGRPSPTR